MVGNKLVALITVNIDRPPLRVEQAEACRWVHLSSWAIALVVLTGVWVLWSLRWGLFDPTRFSDYDDSATNKVAEVSSSHHELENVSVGLVTSTEVLRG